jgi:hypothetical protein
MLTWDTEENAQILRKKYETQVQRKGTLNICSGKAKWNACDYIDYNLQDYNDTYGCLCWKQDGKHDCCHCTEEPS